MKHQAIAPQQWFSAAELAALDLPGVATTKRGVQWIAARDGWAERTNAAGEPLARVRKGRGGGQEFHISLLPEAAQARLLAASPAKVEAERPGRESAWMRWERLPAGARREAEHRLAIINRIEDLQRHGMGKAKAVDWVIGEERRATQDAPSPGTVYRWFADIRGLDAADRLPYLAPGFTGRTSKAEIPQLAFEKFAGDVLRPSEPGYADCYQRLLRIAQKEGWESLPSLKTFMRRLDAEIPRTIQLYLRKGDAALAHAFPHLERSRAGIGALQILNLDGHTWDVNVVWPDGEEGRPLSVAVQDIASSKALALRFDKTLNQHLVRLALADTFRDAGIPETIIMDNGRENTAKSLSGGQATRWRWKVKPEEPAGLLKMLGIEAVWATPYWGQAKPIERMFRDWATGLAKHPAFEGAYTGPSTTAKPSNHGTRAIPIAEFEEIVRAELVHYNARTGRAGAHMAGRSFDQVWNDLVAARPPKRATAEQLRLALMVSEPVLLDRRTNEVRVMDHRYWSQALAEVSARKVVVRFDPENLAAPVHVYGLDGRYLAEAQRIAAGSFNNVADAKEHMRARRSWKKARKEEAKAKVRLDAVEVAAGLREAAPESAPPPAPDSNIVTPAFGVPRQAEDVGGAQFSDAWMAGVSRLPAAG